MEVNYAYLAWFVFYLVIVLGVGLWGWAKVDKHTDFATASQNLSPLLTYGSLFGTFVSAISVIAGTGYASKYGFALLTLLTTGSLAGCAFLTITAKKWHQARVNSVPQLMSLRYNSQFLQTLLAVIIVFTYAVILVAQLFGIGYILEGIIGIPMGIAILTVGLFFVAYTILGEMVSVAHTDVLQSIIMSLGIIITAGVLLMRLVNDPAHTFGEKVELMTVFSGETPDVFNVACYVFVFGLGVAIHPYCVQRLLAARDVKTARRAPILTGFGVLLIQTLLVVIGVIGAIYLPHETGDSIMPTITRELLGRFAGPLAMMAILCGVQSTTDSLLHVVGTYTAQDIFSPYVMKDPSEHELLRRSRIFTAIFGISIVFFTAYQAFYGEVTLIAIIAAYAGGLLGASLFVAIAAGLFWKSATREGAIAAVLTGFLGSVIGHILSERGILPFHEILPATLLSLVAMVSVSLLTERP